MKSLKLFIDPLKISVLIGWYWHKYQCCTDGHLAVSPAPLANEPIHTVVCHHLVTLPAVGDVWAELLVAHHFPHLLNGRVRGHQVIVGQLVVLVDPCRRHTVQQHVTRQSTGKTEPNGWEPKSHWAKISRSIEYQHSDEKKIYSVTGNWLMISD